MSKGRPSLAAALAAAALATVLVTGAASGGPSAAGYNTSQAPMVTLLAGAPADSSADAIISVGDTMPGGYTFESIPDGVSVYPRGKGRADVFVNHETSTVPFPFFANWPQASGVEANQNDYRNAEVSQLIFNQHSAGITHASTAIKSLENFQRFCSNYLATAIEGFKRDILFAPEEAQDWVYRTGTAWPGPSFVAPAAAGAEQSGVVVAYDVKNGKRKPIYGMGRHNHENNIAIPGFDELVMLSGDDTFSTDSQPSSQLYMYKAASSDELWADEGTLYAFVVTSAADNDYFDLQPGETLRGEFVPVPDEIAKGKSSVDGHELTQAVDYPAWPAPTGGAPDGPQWILDKWGDVAQTPALPNDVFDFIRIEDIAYDKRADMSNVVYLADSGRASGGAANPLTTSTNGRIYKMVLDPDGVSNPNEATITILVQGDDSPVGRTGTPALSLASLNEIHQPDNLETTVNGNLLVTEDPSSGNQYDAGSLNSTSARLWKVPLGAADPDASKVPLLSVSQALDENANPALGKVDVDAASAARLGAWESSGIVDASGAFGPGAFFLTVQAHSYWIDKLAGPDLIGNPGADFYYKKEGGQLILLRMPGI